MVRSRLLVGSLSHLYVSRSARALFVRFQGLLVQLLRVTVQSVRLTVHARACAGIDHGLSGHCRFVFFKHFKRSFSIFSLCHVDCLYDGLLIQLNNLVMYSQVVYPQYK